MAYNPYEYRDNKDGIILRGAKATGRGAVGLAKASPRWGTDVAAGQMVRGAYSAYQRGLVNSSKRAAMEMVARRRSAEQFALSRRWADRDVAAARSAANKASLRARVMANRAGVATKQAQEAWDLAQVTRAESAAAITDAQSRAASRIAGATRKGRAAKYFQRTIVDPVAKSAQAEYQAARDLLAESLRGSRRASQAASRAADAARQATARVGEVGAKGLSEAKAAAKWVYDASMNGAPTVTRGQRLAMGAANKYNAVTGAVKGWAKSVGTSAAQMGKNLLKAVNPFGTAEAIAAEAKAAGKVVTTGGKIAKAIGNWAVVKPTTTVAKAGAWAVKAPVKALTKTFGAVERAGQIITAGNTGKVAKFVRGVTSASGLAGSFATQAIIDAAGKAYKFYAEGGKLSDVGAQKITTVNGHQVAEHNPGWADVIFSRDYAKEVLKGFQSALTLGFTAQGDDTFWDKTFERDREQENAELNAMIMGQHEQLRDIHGNMVYSKEEIDKINSDRKTYAMQSKKAQDFFKRTRGSLGVQNFRKMLGDITSERAAALQRMEDNIANFGEFSKGLRKSVTEDDYRRQATSRANHEYDRRLNMLLGNKAAKDVMEENRRSAYALLGEGTGDYDADVKNAAHTESVRSFNQLWTGMSDAERVSWNREDEEKAVNEALAAAEEEAA